MVNEYLRAVADRGLPPHSALCRNERGSDAKLVGGWIKELSDRVRPLVSSGTDELKSYDLALNAEGVWEMRIYLVNPAR